MDADPTEANSPEAKLSELWNAYRLRWQERDKRHAKIDRIVEGDWTALGPDDDPLENRSPNLIQVAKEDTAEAASLVPSVRVRPSAGDDPAKRRAAVMELLGASYLERSEIALLTIYSLGNLAQHGMYAWRVVPGVDGPRIEWRDPRTCYPEPDFSTFTGVRRCFFARDVYVTQLPDEYQKIFLEKWTERKGTDRVPPDWQITLLEYVTEDGVTVAGVYENKAPFAIPGMQTQMAESASAGQYVSMIFEHIPEDVGVTPVIVGQRTADPHEPRGQFDQVIAVLQAHIRLAALSLDYADQAVYSEIWVKDLIGPMSVGGGGYIQLGPNGGIGRVPPAVSSLSVYQELQQLVDNFHIGARWPKVRPGEVDQAIASAKFVEATAGMMNTVIRTYHLILAQSFKTALRICFLLDKKYGRNRTIAGLHKNQQFVISREKSDIDLEADIRVEYGLGLGRDPAQSMVLAIQGSQAGFLSRDFVMENFEGITDVAREKMRLDVQQLQDVLMAKLLQAVQNDAIPPEAVTAIIKGRENGESFAELYEKHVVKAQQEMMAQMVPTMGGPMMPGPDAMAGEAAPPAPDGAELLGLLAGGAPTPPEGESRLSIPMGDGSFAGSSTVA